MTKGHKMNTPSKELVNKVLDKEYYRVEYGLEIDICQTIIYAVRCNAGCCTDSLNIYELAIKTKQTYPDLDLNLAAMDISEFWRQANILAQGANND